MRFLHSTEKVVGSTYKATRYIFSEKLFKRVQKIKIMMSRLIDKYMVINYITYLK